jgi:hypothetical protein
MATATVLIGKSANLFIALMGRAVTRSIAHQLRASVMSAGFGRGDGHG